MKSFTKSRWFVVIGVLLIFGVTAWLLYERYSLIDYSKEEEPFCSMSMPLKEATGSMIMDGGSVTLWIVDRKNEKFQLDFRYDHSSPWAPYTAAYYGRKFMGFVSETSLKNPERARIVCIRLLEDYGSDEYAGDAVESLRRGSRWEVDGVQHKFSRWIDQWR